MSYKTKLTDIYPELRTSANTPQNNGGVFGGIGYVGEKIGLGALQGIEGIWDYSAGGIAKLFGVDEWAERQFANDWLNYQHAEEWYNPSQGWQVAGDVAGGIGTSLPSMGATAAAAAIAFYSGGTLSPVAAGLIAAATAGLSAAGTGTKEAYQQTGELGGKEFGYGALSGLAEGGMEFVTQGIGVGTGRITKAILAKTSKDTAKTMSRISGKSVIKSLVGDFASEAFEEGTQEMLSPVFKRMTYDPNAQNASAEEVAYSAIVGGLSGAIMGGAYQGFNATSNLVSGNKAMQSGSADWYMNAGKQISDVESADATGFEAFKETKSTYEQLVKSLEKTGGEITTAKQKMLLGQLKGNVTSSVFMPYIERSAMDILANADRVAERFAKFKMTDVNGNPISFTAKDITSGINMELYKSENPADKREFFKQVREALSTNSTLATVAVMDTTGNIMLDTQAFAEATLQGENLADKADLNSFIENATPEEISAVQQALGIKDLADVGIEEFRASVGKYTATGKMGEAVKQYQRMQIIEGIKDTEQKPSPTKYNRKTKNGVYHIDGVNKVAVKKEGDKYYLYDKSRKLLSNALTVDEVNEAIKQIKNENRRATETESEPQQTNREEAQELDTLAKEQIKDYSKLNVHNQAIVRGVLRNARRNGISEPDALSFARISAHSGLDIKFSKDACFEGVTKDGEKVYNEGYYSARINKIVVNPEPETTLERTLLHELDHAIRMYYDKDGKIHSKTFKVAMDTVSKEQRENLEKLYAKQDAGVSQEELLADETNALATEQLLSNKGVLEKLVGEEPTFKEKVLEFFKKATGWYSNDSTLEKASRKYYKTYKKLFDEFSARNQQSNFIEAPSYLGVDDTTKRKSFGGVKAKDYDKTAYEKAIEMDKAGKGSEAIRQDTGWFKGYDGKWRFEIDDSEMTLDTSVIVDENTTLKDIMPNSEIYKHYPQLKETKIYQIQVASDGTRGEFNVKTNSIGLSDFFFDDAKGKKRLEEINKSKEHKQYRKDLQEVLNQNGEFWKAWSKESERIDKEQKLTEQEKADRYAEFRKEYFSKDSVMTIEKAQNKFFETEIGKEYKSINENYNKTSVSNSTSAKQALIHEIQHAIQVIEGFSKGANPEFYKDKTILPHKVKEEIRGLSKQYNKALEKIIDKDLSYEYDMYEDILHNEYNGETLSDSDKAEMQAIEKLMKANGVEKEFNEALDVDYKQHTLLETYAEDDFDAYYYTAGEIESRDVANRLLYSPEERKSIRPDIDDDNYALAEEYELDVGNPYISAGDSSVRFNRKLVETHEDSIRKVVEKSGSMKPEALEQLFKKYRETVSIWDEVTKAVNSQFLNEWNGREGKDRIYSIFKAQMGYKYQQELASECKKGMSLFDTIDAIVKRNVMSDKAFRDAGIDKLGKREKEILYEILKGKGFQIPCAVCFVEQSRQREGEVIDRFLNGHKPNNKIGWNSTLDRIEEDMKELGVDFKFQKVSRDIATDAYQKANLRMTSEQQDAFYKAIVKEANLVIDRQNAEIRKDIAKGKKTKDDLKKKIKDSSLDSINEILKGSLPANLKIFRTLVREPSSRLRFDDDLLYSSITTSNLASKHHEFYTLFNSQGGQAGYKIKQSPVIYWGDLLEKRWGSGTLRKNGGIRTQSNSDFQVYTFLDIAQEFVDMTAKGYYLQAYTKVVPMLKLFGLSGAKLNASLIPFVKVYYQKDANGKIRKDSKTGEPVVDLDKTMENAGLDENGNLLFDDFEGINHLEVFNLLKDAEYSKNVGAICIAYSDNHLFKLLDDDRIQLIIGYHDKKNDPLKRYVGARYVKNYNGENEAINSEGKTVHIAFNEYVMDSERLFRKGKKAFSDKLSAKVKSMLENIDTQYDAKGKIESINFDGKQYKYDDIPRLSADIYLYDCKVKGYKPAYTNPSLDFNDPKQPFRHRNYYKVLADFSLYNSEGHYAPHRKVNFTLPKDIPIYDRKTDTQRTISPEKYLVGELRGELETRDSLANALAETGEESIFGQFKTRATNPDYIVGSMSQAPVNLGYMGDGVSNAYKYYFDEGNRKSLKAVAPIKPTTDGWKPTIDTAEAKRRFPNLWDITADSSTKRNPTQISETVSTYRKIFSRLKSEGFNGTILDASSGLGKGTEVGRKDFGFNIDDIEPYPDASYKPKYNDYSTLHKKYDVIISNAVLNVLPQDQRDALVVKMGELLKDGGRMYINTRGEDVKQLASNPKNVRIGDMEWYVGSKGSYQKGFTKNELVAYLKDALGSNYDITPVSFFGKSSAIVKKNASVDGDIRKSIKQAVDSEGRTLSEEQTEFFKDSAIRDENGNLLGMYHGTNADFWEFSMTHSGGKNGKSEGYGIYLADDKEVARHYGSRIIPLYANIKKPLYSNKKTITKAGLAKLIKDTVERQADQIVNDGYDNKAQAIKDTWISNYVYTYDDKYRNIANAYRDVAQLIFDSADNDADVVQELMNGSGVQDYESAVRFYEDSLIPILGYDGIVTKWDGNDGKEHKIVLAFAPNQLKQVDNRNPSLNNDIRYSRKTPISPTRESVRTTIDPQYKPTRADKIFSGWTAGQIAFTNQQAGIEAVGKQYGIKNIESLVQSARAGKAQADEMIGGNQYRIGGEEKERLGDGLQKILEPIVSKGEEIEGDFYDYLFNYHNISRMTLQERSLNEQEERQKIIKDKTAELNNYQKEIIRTSKRIDKLGNSKADKAKKKALKESIKEYREKSQMLIKELKPLEKESESFVPLENKPIFSTFDEKLKMEVLVTAEDSKKIVEKYEKEYSYFKETAEKLWKFLQNLNQYRVDTGLLSQDMSEYLQKLYPNYVPTYRSGDTKGIGAIDGKYNLRVKSTIKRAKGSTRDLQKLDYIIAKQVLETVRAGRINQLANALYEGAINSKDDTYVEVVSKEKVKHSEMADFDPAEVRPKNNEIVFFRNGERITIRVAKEIFAGFEAFNPKTEIHNPLINGAVAINNNFKRLVTSLNPAFLARNSIRDIQDAGINTRYGKTFLKNYAKAMQEITSNGELWQLYKAMGGFSSTLFDFDKGIVGTQNKWGLTKAEGNLLKKTLTKVENANAFVEQLPRFAEFMSSLEAGNTAEQAILDSADVTTNFGRSGKITKVLNRTLIPFLNPSIQGFSKMIRNITSIRTAKEFSTLLIKVALVGLAPQLLNTLMYDDDDDYEKLRMNDKENNFLFKIGNKFIKVPRGRVASAVGGLINRTSTAIKGQDADWKGYVDNVIQQVSPVDSMSRTIFSPLINDLPTNTTWYGSPIEGRQFENTAPKDRYDESTSSIAIAMGKALNYSPKKIHYLLDQYSGVIGDFILPATTKKAERGFISGNFTIDPELSNRLSSDFYKLYDKAQYAKTAGDETAKYQVQYLNRVRGAISQMFQEKKKIQESDLSKVEKLKQTRVVQTLINEAYKTALADYKGYTEAIKATEGVPDAYRATEATRQMFGAKTAFEQYNKDVSAKMDVLNKAGIDYDTLYSYYFGTKDLENDIGRNGEPIKDSKRNKVLRHINSLPLSKDKKAVLFASKGYSFRDGEIGGMKSEQMRRMLLNYILRLNISKSEKEYLAKMCGFEVHNGRIINPFVKKYV